MFDRVNANAREIDGRMQYPHMHGDDGWYHFTPEPFAPAALEVYYLTEDRTVLDLLPAKPRWVAFLDGEDPDYPQDALLADLAAVRERGELLRKDTSTPDTRMSDDMNHINPAQIDALNQLMLGGLPTGRPGYPLHCRVRYFDPVRRRAGIPEDVAALVERLDGDEVVLTLVNVHQGEARTTIVQAGAYGEHQIVSVEADGVRTPVDAPHLTVRLAPGAAGRLTLHLQRYANRPTFAFPWV